MTVTIGRQECWSRSATGQPRGPLAARARQPGQVRMAESDAWVQTRIAAFKTRASKVGWADGGLQRQFGLMSASLTIFSHTPRKLLIPQACWKIPRSSRFLNLA